MTATPRRRVEDDHGRVNVRKEPLTYERGNGRSFFGDLILTAVNDTRSEAAQRRLERHRREAKVEYERRAVAHRLAFDAEMAARGWTAEQPAAVAHRPVRSAARAGRVFAALVRGVPLPAGTDSINIPRLTAGPAAAIQTADNAAVQETDPAESGIACPVRTVAGHQDIDVSPSAVELRARVAEDASTAATARNLPPTAILMQPRRWFWIAAGLDGASRQLVPPTVDVPPLDERSDRRVGTFASLPVFIDPSIPTNRGAGTNEDAVIITRPSDAVLFESDTRVSTHVDPGAGTLSRRLTLHRYTAFTAARYPTGTDHVGDRSRDARVPMRRRSGGLPGHPAPIRLGSPHGGPAGVGGEWLPAAYADAGIADAAVTQTHESEWRRQRHPRESKAGARSFTPPAVPPREVRPRERHDDAGRHHPCRRPASRGGSC